jgi:hypothetical protein
MVEEYTITQIMQAIKRSWAQETSYTPDQWSVDNPARGQCVISALVINDYFGGTYQRFEILLEDGREKHYVNVLPDGVVIDVAGMQYSSEVKRTLSPLDPTNPQAVRDKLLKDPGTAERYELLKKRVKTLLKQDVN